MPIKHLCLYAYMGINAYIGMNAYTFMPIIGIYAYMGIYFIPGSCFQGDPSPHNFNSDPLPLLPPPSPIVKSNVFSVINKFNSFF